MVDKQVSFSELERLDDERLHPLVQQQLSEATEAPGKIDVRRLLSAISACYQASADLAQNVLEQSVSENDCPANKPACHIDGLSLPMSAFDSVYEGIIIIDGEGQVHSVNQSACSLLDLNILTSPSNFVGVRLDELLRSIDQDTCSSLQRLLEEPQSCGTETIHNVHRSDGKHVTLRARRFDQGWVLTVQKSHDDALLNEHEATGQMRLRDSGENEYRTLFDNAVIGIYRTDLCGKQLRANPALVQLHGYDSENELLCALNDDQVECYVDPERRKTFKRTLATDGRVTDFVSQIYQHKSRERIWISENAWLVSDADGEPLFCEGTVVDASERMAAEEEINHLAHHDHLTGLPNRFMLLKKLREAILQPHMATSLAVHCLDLDHFKDVNDTLGHQAGDKLLITAGERLRSSIKASDVLARIGGDEFTILQYGVRSSADVESLAARVVESMNEPFWICEQQVNIGVSVGVAIFKGQEPTELLRDADVALYESKKSGRRTYCLYTAHMGNVLRERRALEDDLRDAVENGNFDLYLQPIVDATTTQASVYEALLRWDHPTRGSVSPSSFVPVAEESSLMVALGDWVLNKTVEAAAYLPPGKRIAMNLSPLQLRNRNFVQQVRAAMDRLGVSADQLEVEITETVIMSDDVRTLGTLNALRDMGLRMALDDFGTGHASLSYLQRFRFDKIKIDRSFVERMVEDPISAAVVRAVTSLGADMGAVVVAEGVETEAQVTALRREGCHLFQGYRFGHPTDWRLILKPPGWQQAEQSINHSMQSS